MNENNANFTPAAPNFKTLVRMSFQGLTNFPYIEEDFDALTNYGLLSKVVEYLNEVISNNNEQNTVITNLYNAYVSLQDYVNDYFDNLDVQEEINNKLDAMAQDGSLTLLIKNYVDPYIDAQNEEISDFKSSVNSTIASQNTKINNLESGSPLVASSTAGMTNTSRVYVNTTDGKWYYYDGDSWEIGGTYQSSGLADGSVTLTKLNGDIFGTSYRFNGTKDSVGVGVYFVIPDNVYKASDIETIKVDFNITNQSTTSANGVLYAHIEHQGFWGTNILIPDNRFNKYSDPTKTYHVEGTSAEQSLSQDTYINRVGILYYNVAGTYDFTISDVKIYINGELLELTFDSSLAMNEWVTQSVDPVTFVAKKEYIQAVAKELNDRMDEIEEELPSEDDLAMAKAYDSVSKSTYYKIACWGDSLTAGAYPSDLSTFIGNPNVTVYNKGHSGEASGTVAFRQGANKITTAEAITIPASNNEDVQFAYNVSTGFLPNIARIDCNCSISGVPGTLAYHYENSNWSLRFTRTESGEAVSVPSGTQLIYDGANDYNDNISIIWLGRNDIAFSYPHIVDGVISNTKGIVDNLSPVVKRFIVMGTTNSTNGGIGTATYNDILAINNGLRALYPNNFFDVRTYLNHQCIYDLNIEPTAEDIQAMEDDCLPPSLSYDGIHLTAGAYNMVAKQLYELMLSKGWIIK